VVQCTDAQNQSVLSNSFRIIVRISTIPGENQPPSFTTRWTTQGVVGQEYIYDVNASDPENDTLIYGLDRAPPDMTIDNATGRISWVPRAIGSFDVSLFVTDGCSTVYQNFTITVPNRPPRMIETAVPYARVGEAFLFQVPAQDDDGDPLTYTLASAPDKTMTVNSTTGLINWTPAAIGSFKATIRVSDGIDSTSYDCFITVLPGNHAPKFQSVPVTAAYVGLQYIYQANATDADGDPLAYSLEQMPDGMALDNLTGKITWMPGGAGSCPVILKASDEKGGKTVQEFTIVVSERTRPKVEIIDPANDATVKGRTTVGGKAFRGTLDIAKVQLRVDGKDWTDAVGNWSWKYTLDTTKLKNGKHAIEARAYDGMDFSDIASRTVTVDNARSSGKGFIPGFEALPVLLAAAALLVLRRKWK
jgi:hypothetical protein